jgi:hypothetical protein
MFVRRMVLLVICRNHKCGTVIVGLAYVLSMCSGDRSEAIIAELAVEQVEISCCFLINTILCFLLNNCFSFNALTFILSFSIMQLHSN